VIGDVCDKCVVCKNQVFLLFVYDTAVICWCKADIHLFVHW